MIMKLRTALAALLLGLSVAPPVAAQDLRVALGSAVTSADPHFTVLGANSALARNVFDGLINQDDTQGLVPGLALSWTALDTTTWEFKLRDGVRFHDGSPFEAEDVAASLRRVAAVKGSPSSFLPFVRPIKAVTAVDRLTLRIETTAPYPLLPGALSRIAIVPRGVEQAGQEAFNAATAAHGTGPYRLVAYVPGERIVLARNEAHWGGKPRWERVTLRIVPNDSARIAALLAGDVDLIENVPTTGAARLRADDRIRLARVASNRVMYIHLDSDRAQSPFVRDRAGAPTPNHLRDVRVRQAISTAIDRQALVDRVMDGEGVPTGQFVPPGYFGHAPEIGVPKGDRDAARRMLGEAGVPDGFKLTFHAPNDRYPNDEQTAMAIAAMLTRAGIETNVVAIPAATYFTRASALEFSFILGGAAAETGEASSVLRPLVESFDPARGAGSGNRGRFSDPGLDRLMVEALATIDAPAREAKLRAATRIATDKVGVIPLFFLVNTWASRGGVSYVPRSDGYTLAENARP
jgi:peptide/nickel transport system substrate-binding protein